jgi:hypothetical protein
VTLDCYSACMGRGSKLLRAAGDIVRPLGKLLAFYPSRVDAIEVIS